MADTPKTPEKKPAGNPNAARRVAARKLREEEQQRLVLIVTAAAIGLALLAVLGGVLYDQLWLPSRPVARVGSAELSRRTYWEERRASLARQVVQNFQLLALFGGNAQFAQQFQGQSPVINQQVASIRSAEVDTATVGEWEARQVKEQGAAGMGISASDDEVRQAMARDLGVIFLPPPTEPITPTAEAAATTAPVTATAEITPTAGGPTATPAATATPAPSETPPPTPAPAEAGTQVDQILDEIYRRFEIELAASGTDPELTKDDFRAALSDQYREQVLTEKVQAELVKAEGFAFASEPTRVGARQVLVAVTPPEGATQEQIDAAFAEAKAEADAIAAELRSAGADFAAVAAESSDDPGSREQGGDLGTFDRNGSADSGVTYPPELVEQAFTLEQGTISDPIRTQFGWHIIEVTSRDVPSEEQQLREARTEAFDTWVEEQRAALEIARFPEPSPTPSVAPTEAVPTAVPTFLPGPPTAAPTETPAPADPAATSAPTAPEVTPTATAQP